MDKLAYPIDADGTDIISEALKELLNQFPGIEDQEILFSTLDQDGGIGFFPTSGAVIVQENESITGHVTQLCQYPFFVVFRASPNSEAQKIKIKQFLDNLGRWIEKQPVEMNGTVYTLKEYPSISEGRKIRTISRNAPGYLDNIGSNGTEDWVISITLKYETEFER